MGKTETANIYRTEMKGIASKIAMQSIRKVIRDPKINDVAKLNIIMAIVHDYEEDQEAAEAAEERRAIEADEAEMRRRRLDDLFDLDEATAKLTTSTTGTGGK